MEHLAIMRKSWGLTQKILNSQKTIESRWYSAKCKPWDNIKEGEIIYFKDSGEPVRSKAEVSKVIQFTDLNPGQAREVLDKYREGLGLEKEEIPEFFEKFKKKKYCILMFLKNPEEIEPFEINKAGFGAMAAWITVDNISRIKK